MGEMQLVFSFYLLLKTLRVDQRISSTVVVVDDEVSVQDKSFMFGRFPVYLSGPRQIAAVSTTGYKPIRDQRLSQFSRITLDKKLKPILYYPFVQKKKKRKSFFTVDAYELRWFFSTSVELNEDLLAPVSLGHSPYLLTY